MLKKFWPLVLIIIISFFAVRPLLNSGFFSFHDEQQVARLFEMDKSLAAGQFPVRWVTGLGFGLGYPLFNFYPPLIYYLGEVVHLIGFGFIDSIKIIWAISIIGSGITMYFLAKEFFGKIGGLVSALFYVYAPYHAIDAYVRGALAELFSFLWLPLILLFANKPIISGIFLGLLMITHNLIFLPFVGIYILWSRNIKNIFVSLTIAFGLTTFFWLPALWEKQFTLVDDLLIKNLASYKIHFVCLSQLWNSPWGFGGSIAGCVDGMSFKLGKLHIIASLLALLIAVIKKSKIIFVIFLLFIFSVFMTTQHSGFIWDRIPQLWYLQFPWRFLEFAALFSSLLVGSFLVIATPPWRGKQSILAIALITILLFFNAKLFEPREYYAQMTDDQLTSDQEIQWKVSSTSFEYLPRGLPTKAVEYEVQNTKYKLIGGDFRESSQNFLPDKFTLTGTSLQGATLQFTIANFPGWKVWVDGQKTKTNDNNKYKLITVTVPAGQHSIVGKFTNTPIRTLGNLISLVSIVSFLLALVIKFRFNYAIKK